MAPKPSRKDVDYPRKGGYRGSGSADLPKAPTSAGASHNRSASKPRTPGTASGSDKRGQGR
jgi:hypothetical protein